MCIPILSLIFASLNAVSLKVDFTLAFHMWPSKGGLVRGLWGKQLPQGKSMPHSASLQTGLGEHDITATIRTAHWLWEWEAGKYGVEGRAIPRGLWNKPEMGPECPHRLGFWSSLGYLCDLLHGVCVYHGRNQSPRSYRLQCRFRRA